MTILRVDVRKTIISYLQEDRIDYTAINNIEGLLRAAAIDGLQIDVVTI